MYVPPAENREQRAHHARFDFDPCSRERKIECVVLLSRPKSGLFGRKEAVSPVRVWHEPKCFECARTASAHDQAASTPVAPSAKGCSEPFMGAIRSELRSHWLNMSTGLCVTPPSQTRFEEGFSLPDLGQILGPRAPFRSDLKSCQDILARFSPI